MNWKKILLEIVVLTMSLAIIFSMFVIPSQAMGGGCEKNNAYPNPNGCGCEKNNAYPNPNGCGCEKDKAYPNPNGCH